MSKSTLFIAVQCCQCSTMQVKQKKKSSNKWNCAVCNEKQSVRKVYAQGYQAKDIRQVVQAFNMSRKFADDRELDYHESSLGHFVEHLECNQDTVEAEQKAKRRTDWSEYVDVDEDSLEPAYLKTNLQGKEGFEEKVVTQLPEELMFKKPKLKGSFGSTSVKTGENQSYKPQFSKKSGASRAAAVTKVVLETGSVSPSVSSGWTGNRNNVDFSDHSRFISSQSQQRQQKCKGAAVLRTGASRWAEYLTEDNADGYQGEGMVFTDESRLTDGYKVQTNDADLLVEEDIHPDFM